MEGTVAEIRLFAGNFAPLGWAFCDGSLMAIAEYDAVYSLLGNTFGGDGQLTFGLPDLRGRVAVHIGTGTGLTPVVAGQMSGSESVTLLSNQIPAHVHGVTMNTAATTLNFKISSEPGTVTTPVAGSSLSTHTNAGGEIKCLNSSAPNMAINAALPAVSVTNSIAGASLPHENMMPFQCVNYIICLEGIYPSRP